jgi:hypothetical protein
VWVPSRAVRCSSLLPGCLFVVNIVIGWYGLALVNVPLFLCIRRTTTAFTMFAEFIILRKTQTWTVQSGVLLIVGGAVIAGWDYLSSDGLGIAYTVVNNICTAISMNMTKKFSDNTKTNVRARHGRPAWRGTCRKGMGVQALYGASTAHASKADCRPLPALLLSPAIRLAPSLSRSCSFLLSRRVGAGLRHRILQLAGGAAVGAHGSYLRGRVGVHDGLPTRGQGGTCLRCGYPSSHCC